MKRITFTVQVPAEAELVVKLPSGVFRPPSPDELHKLGYKHQNEMFERTRDLLHAAGLHDEESDTYTALRYFIEYITHYTHEPPEDAVAGMRELIAGRLSS